MEDSCWGWECSRSLTYLKENQTYIPELCLKEGIHGHVQGHRYEELRITWINIEESGILWHRKKMKDDLVPPPLAFTGVCDY